MAYAKFRSDNLAGINLGKYLASVRIEEALENGCFVQLGGYEEGQREVRVGLKPGADTPLNKLCVLGSEEVVKAKAYDTVGDFINEAGSIARGYILSDNDIFSITAEALTGETPEVDLIVCVNEEYKAIVAEDAEGTAIGKIIAVEGEWIVVQVDASLSA